MSEANEAELVRRTLRGEREAFQVLVNRYQHPVYMLALSWLHDPMESQDVTQEAFFIAYRRLPELKDARKFRAWLYGIARNLSSVVIRKRRMIDDTVPLETVEDSVADRSDSLLGMNAQETHDDLLAQLHVGLNNLPDKYQTLLRLKYLSGYSYQEISEMVDLPDATVRSRLFEARRMLREQIQAKSRMER